jgi:hypothetical protein
LLSHQITNKLSLPELIKLLNYGTPELKTNSPLNQTITEIGFHVLDIPHLKLDKKLTLLHISPLLDGTED